MIRYIIAMRKSHPEPHTKRSNSKLNALRAAVLGANDGIVSVASIVVGVAGAASSKSAIFTSGIAGLVAGALSMAAGEFVSVSSQRDSEKSLLEEERTELRKYPKQELRELQDLYVAKGLKKATAKRVAAELTAKDAYAAHIDIELGIDPDNLTNPWHAAVASAASFFVGALIPLLAILLAAAHIRLVVTFMAVLLALTLTGYLSAAASDTNKFKATVRVVLGGALAMVVTYTIGRLVGGRVS
jgi:VIT1/CCC1 family predicted Fe2+/Mn2+ transporter